MKYGQHVNLKGIGTCIFVGSITTRHLFYRSDDRGWIFSPELDDDEINGTLLNRVIAGGYQNSLWWVVKAHMELF